MTDQLNNDFYMVRELSKAQIAYNNLSVRYDILHDFVKRIVKDWACDPNHASAILAEVERMKA